MPPRVFYGNMAGMAEEPAREHLGRDLFLMRSKGREAFFSIGYFVFSVSFHLFFNTNVLNEMFKDLVFGTGAHAASEGFWCGPCMGRTNRGEV